jgi:HEAT repeat protein
MLLVRDAGPESEGLLKKALADKDWSVRAVSTQMIAYTGRASLREDLTPLFKDKNDKVRFRAAGAYLHFALIARSAGPAQ